MLAICEKQQNTTRSIPRASAEISDTTVPTAIRAARSAGKRYTPVEIAGNAIERSSLSAASVSAVR